MKEGIHPKYENTKVTCLSCGKSWETRSTRKELRVDVCSNCHPFYSGEQRLMDTAGQVDRFMKRLQSTQAKQSNAANRKAAPVAQPKKSLYQEVFGEEKPTE